MSELFIFAVHRNKYLLFKYLIFLIAIPFLFFSCSKKKDSYVTVEDTKENFWKYLKKGNEFYAKKNGIASVSESQAYFDTAAHIASRLKDSFLIAESVFAEGRVYDAWNKEPSKTIEYYQRAADLYGTIDSLYDKHLYLVYHVAHAYAKNIDTINCIREIRGLCKIFEKMAPEKLHSLRFISEVGMLCTEVGHYSLGKEILDKYTDPDIINNDPETLNYKDHYILAQTRIEIFNNKLPPYKYLDSLEMVFNNSKTIFDSMYYSDVLKDYYYKVGDYKKAYLYQEKYTDVTLRVMNKQDFEKLSNRLALMEAESLEQRNKLDRKSGMIWFISFSGLCLLAAGSLYSNIVFRKSSNKYYNISKQLEVSNRKTTLLYKELHHRIKNNLHMIFSLLQMQERRSDDPHTIENLKAARLRIESIAVMHEEMMQQEYKVDFKNFLHRMISAVTECFSFDRHIITHLNINDTQIPQKQSFSLALIINEWISNSIKHATTEGHNLEIFVNIIDEGHQVWIQYYDNGSIDPDQIRKEGLGSQIIQLLSKQLNASVSNDILHPYHYSLRISK